MTDATQHLGCPSCGDRDHLYRRADVRWSHDQQEWVLAGDIEATVDCTECDWEGPVSDLSRKDPDDASPD